MTGRSTVQKKRKSKKDRLSSNEQDLSNSESRNSSLNEGDDDGSSSKKRVIPPSQIKCTLHKCPYCEFASKFPFSVGRHLRVHKEQYAKILNGETEVPGISIREATEIPRTRRPNKSKPASPTPTTDDTNSNEPKQRKKRAVKKRDILPTISSFSSSSSSSTATTTTTPLHDSRLHQDHSAHPPVLTQQPLEPFHTSYQSEHFFHNERLPELDLYSNSAANDHMIVPHDEFGNAVQYNPGTTYSNWNSMALMPDGSSSTSSCLPNELSSNFPGDQLSPIPNHMLQQPSSNTYYSSSSTITQMRNMEFDSHHHNSSVLPLQYDTSGMYNNNLPPQLSHTDAASSTVRNSYGIPGSQAACSKKPDAADRPKRKRKSQTRNKSTSADEDGSFGGGNSSNNKIVRRRIKKQKIESEIAREKEAKRLHSLEKRRLKFAQKKEAQQSNNPLAMMISHSTASKAIISAGVDVPQMNSTGSDGSVSSSSMNLMQLEKTEFNSIHNLPGVSDNRFPINTITMEESPIMEPIVETLKRPRRKKSIPDNNSLAASIQSKRRDSKAKLQKKEEDDAETKQIILECLKQLTPEEYEDYRRTTSKGAQLAIRSSYGNSFSPFSTYPALTASKERHIGKSISTDEHDETNENEMQENQEQSQVVLPSTLDEIGGSDTLEYKLKVDPQEQQVKKQLVLGKRPQRMPGRRTKAKSLDFPSIFPSIGRCLEPVMSKTKSNKDGPGIKRVMKIQSAINDKRRLKSSTLETNENLVQSALDSDSQAATEEASRDDNVEPIKEVSFKCKKCTFSTQHGFNFMIHEKIHQTVDCLPDFFQQLLNVNGNKEKLFAAEPTF